MSKIHFIDTIFKEKFSEKNIDRILRKGLDLGFVYFKNILDEDFVPNEIICLDKALNKILSYKRPITNVISDENSIIETRFKDTHFSLDIGQSEEGLLKVSIFDFTNAWKKEFWNHQERYCALDVERYLRLLLKLCEDFTIINLEKGEL